MVRRAPLVEIGSLVIVGEEAVVELRVAPRRDILEALRRRARLSRRLRLSTVPVRLVHCTLLRARAFEADDSVGEALLHDTRELARVVGRLAQRQPRALVALVEYQRLSPFRWRQQLSGHCVHRAGRPGAPRGAHREDLWLVDERSFLSLNGCLADRASSFLPEVKNSTPHK